MEGQPRKRGHWPRILIMGGLVGLAILGLLAGVFRFVSGTSVFSSTIHITAYVDNAAGLQKGAVVSLEGVRIGNVSGISIPDSPPNPAQPIRIDMRVSANQQKWLREDSMVQIATKGPMGDAAVGIERGTPDSPPARNGSVLPARVATPTAAVVISAHTLLENANLLMSRVSAMGPRLKSGTAGKLMGPNDLSPRLTAISRNTAELRSALTSGSGSAARLLSDPALRQSLRQTQTSVHGLQRQIAGPGSMGGFLHDKRLPNDLAGLKTNLAESSAHLKQAHGAIGKLLYDPATTAQLHRITGGMQSIGRQTGSLHQMLHNPELPQRKRDLAAQIHDLVREMRANPRDFFRIHLDLF